MPYRPPQACPSKTIAFRVAATAWGNHLRCRVRRCRRDRQCTGKTLYYSLPRCILHMSTDESTAMMDFFADTADLATPEMVAESLAQAKTGDERQLIAYRRNIFLMYHNGLATAGLAEPLGPPFIEGGAVSP